MNDDDVTIVGANYAPGIAKPFWTVGDFDYNGFVDDDDVTLLGAFYNPAGPAPPPERQVQIEAVTMESTEGGVVQPESRDSSAVVGPSIQTTHRTGLSRLIPYHRPTQVALLWRRFLCRPVILAGLIHRVCQRERRSHCRGSTLRA